MKRLLIFITTLLVSILFVGGCGMDITNPQVFDHIKEANGATLRCKVIDVGVWDMDAVPNVNVTHGLTHTTIRKITAILRDDADSQYFTLPAYGFGGAIAAYIDATTNLVTGLTRIDASFFDSVLYDDAVMNRGWVFIWYED